MEPEYYGEVAYEGIVNGDIDGSWLLSYWCLEGDTVINIAVFDTRTAALKMAAEIDQVRGHIHCWRLDTVFLNPSDVTELLAMLGGNETD